MRSAGGRCPCWLVPGCCCWAHSPLVMVRPDRLARHARGDVYPLGGCRMAAPDLCVGLRMCNNIKL